MARDPRKQQRKVERRKAKAKAKRKALAQRKAQGLADHLARAATMPILHCRAGSTIWDDGLGPLVVSRELSANSVAAAVFLLDVYCLGVKDVWSALFNRAEYDLRFFPEAFSRSDPVDMQPECARKLVEGAVAYAADLGFAPGGDYRRSRMIFGDIDPNACTRTFTYGRQGKPFFVAGTHDSAVRCRDILATLEARCGPDGFDYLIGADRLPASW